MNTEAMFSSKTDLWSTPQQLYDTLDLLHKFELDPCCNLHNCKCKYGFWVEEYDGLKEDWSKFKSVFMNPPYGREIGKWVEKAREESLKGCKVVCLLPARTDTRWFHKNIYGYSGATVQFIKGRLKFGGSKNSAPFPSMIVIFQGVKP
jgi:phage N-6-adenine-methyltransferase